MRLIDADALMDYFLKRSTEEFLYKRQFTAEDVSLMIQRQPEVKAVTHGHWKSIRWYVRCSVCDANYDEFGAEGWYYCPNCGARMDEDV